jgi:hypothetical protein
MGFCQQFRYVEAFNKHAIDILDQAHQLDKPYISEHCSMHVLVNHQRQIAASQRSGCPVRQTIGLGRACRRGQLSNKRGPSPAESIAGPSFESIDSDDFLSPVATLVRLLWFCSCGLPWQRDV